MSESYQSQMSLRVSQGDYHCQRHGQYQHQAEGLREGKCQNWMRLKLRPKSGG